MTTNIDPIVKEADSPLSSEPGCVVVAKSKRGYRTFLDDKGPTFGERMFAGFSKYYLVDVSEKEIADTFDAPSKKGALPFKLTVEYYVAVERMSADRIVQNAVRDLAKVFRDPLRRHLSAVARRCDVNDVNGARDILEPALTEFSSDNKDFRFRPGLVEVSLDAETAAKVRTIDSAALDIEHGKAAASVTSEEIERQRELLKSDQSLLAAYQATGEAKYLDALKFRLNEAEKSRAERLTLLKTMIEKEYIEEMDIPRDLIKELVGSLTSNLSTGRIDYKTSETRKADPKLIEGNPTTVDSDRGTLDS